MSYIQSLTLTSFRNYQSASIDGLDNGFVILIGENGAGKTNCLEAVSLLSPGRGVRGATVPEIQSQSSDVPWVVAATMIDDDGDAMHLGVGRDPIRRDKRIVRADGEPVKNQTDLADIARCVWITPQMDGLFLQGASERRRFFDRLVSHFDGAHSGRMTRYEKAMRERLNILKQAFEKQVKPDDIWLGSLENIMAETSVAIAVSRNQALDYLSHAMQVIAHDAFPETILQLDGEVERALLSQSALSVEDMVREKLKAMRMVDGGSGRTNFGISKTDMVALYADKNMPAAQCSTGEQKALLTAIVLAHAAKVKSRHGVAPIMIFDEVGAHFDAHRRDALFDILASFNGQVWLSGQEQASFESIEKNNAFLVSKNAINPCA